MHLTTGDVALAGANLEEFSQPVSMSHANAISVGMSVSLIAGISQIEVFVQESNDLENWEDVASFSLSRDSIGYREGTASGLSMAYVRLRYSTDADKGVVFSIKAHTAKL